MIGRLLAAEEFRRLQLALVLKPDRGALIRGSDGIRKLRWGRSGKGKRGGLRILYFWDAASQRIYLLFAYEKTRRDDLTKDQLQRHARTVREELL